MQRISKYFGIIVFIVLIRLSLWYCERYETGASDELPKLPLVINTWNFSEANAVAWRTLHKTKHNTPLDALVEGLSTCERLQCDNTVGYGGSPDEKGETTLDAILMDGSNMNIGAVAGLREIKHAARVARHVLENTEHTLLVGDAASDFAEMMGYKREPLSTQYSKDIYNKWLANDCQPNFWNNVSPDPKQQCGPYKPLQARPAKTHRDRFRYEFGRRHHDTIGMIVIGESGNVYAGTSTNGAKHKIPGRVGDSPIPGSGAFAENEVGAAVATGDGDIIMRFAPAAIAVELMRMGLSPAEAAEKAIRRILKHYPQLSGAIIVADRHGQYSAACAGIEQFPYAIVQGDPSQESRIEFQECIKAVKETQHYQGDDRKKRSVDEHELEFERLPEQTAKAEAQQEINNQSIEQVNDILKGTIPKESLLDLSRRLQNDLGELYMKIRQTEKALNKINEKLLEIDNHS